MNDSNNPYGQYQNNGQGPYQQNNYQQQQGGYQQGGYQQQQAGYQQGYQQGYQGGFQQQYQQYTRPYVENTANNAFNVGPEGKSRGVFAILALLCGTIGLQYFYINKVAAGIITILLCLVTCGAWAVVNLIQGIIVLWAMSNADFDRKFVAPGTSSTFPVF